MNSNIGIVLDCENENLYYLILKRILEDYQKKNKKHIQDFLNKLIQSGYLKDYSFYNDDFPRFNVLGSLSRRIIDKNGYSDDNIEYVTQLISKQTYSGYENCFGYVYKGDGNNNEFIGGLIF